MNSDLSQICYKLDDETHRLIELACNFLATLAEAQISEEAGEDIMSVVDEIARRFSIGSYDTEIVKGEDGEEELIVKPSQDLFPEDRDTDSEKNL